MKALFPAPVAPITTMIGSCTLADGTGKNASAYHKEMVAIAKAPVRTKIVHFNARRTFGVISMMFERYVKTKRRVEATPNV